MKKNIRLFVSTLLVTGLIGLLATNQVFAAETIGTVTGKDGDVKDKVKITADVVSADGSHITFKDVDTGEEYETSFGPSWYSKVVEIGNQVELIGVVTDSSNNDNGHNFQVLEIDGVSLRDGFEGRPSWSASRGSNGTGSAKGSGSMGAGSRNQSGSRTNSGFVDADNDGSCDNR
ncbi:hypothetical protein JW887_00670 [Candidatus Dojkabacteria bacterium]|nr:hypothetical protein [Candidatus Dojkabacteria bacterium]